MLAYQSRLTQEKDFHKVLKYGKVINRKLFVIKVIPNATRKSRCGIIVSNKISKKATVRNLLKRQLRFLIRQNLAYFKKPVDMAIIVQSDIRGKNYSQLKEVFLAALKKDDLI